MGWILQSPVTDRGRGGYLRHKHQAESDGAAEDDDQGHNAELHVGLVARQEGDGGPDDAHDAHVVHAHPDVLAVVEGGDAHVAGFPRQETAEQLKREQTWETVITRQRLPSRLFEPQELPGATNNFHVWPQVVAGEGMQMGVCVCQPSWFSFTLTTAFLQKPMGGSWERNLR